METGYKIRILRMSRGLTLKALGKEVGFSERTADIRIAQYESGNRNPKAEMLGKLAFALSIKPEFLLSYPTRSDVDVIAYISDAIAQGYLIPYTFIEDNGNVRNVLLSDTEKISRFIGYAATINNRCLSNSFNLLAEQNYLLEGR